MKNYKIYLYLFCIGLAFAMAGCAKPKDGEQGVQGEKGNPGPVGTDGRIATVVQLCTGTTTYSNVFVEVALCINNELYGVYSANGGFLTKLPPGNYSSNAIGSACNLQVLANCVVNPL